MLRFLKETLVSAELPREVVVEEEARQRGCVGVFLYTYSFQAPGFYQKQGYQPMGVLDDCPPGYQRIYLKKSLTA